MSFKSEAMVLLKKTIIIRVDVKAPAEYLVEKIIEPKLQKMVDNTSTPIDNIMVASLMPEIKKEIGDATQKANDFVNSFIKKIFGNE